MNIRKSVWIVIVNYNNEKDTLKCLRSLKKQRATGLSLFFCLIDNGQPVDNAALNKLNIKNLIHRVSPKNIGFAAGNNIAIRRAIRNGADYVLLFNSDAIPDSTDLIENLVDHGTDMAAPILKFEVDGEMTYDYGGKIDYWFGRNRHLTRFQKRGTQVIADYYSGACLLVRVDVFRKIGLFDESFFMYYEDADLCIRAKRNGFSLGLSTKSMVYHSPSTTVTKTGKKKLKLLVQSHWTFSKKNLKLAALPFYGLYNGYLRLKSLFA